ncbi:hypothetical protein [Flagellimonas nanhaiensis]|uniref:Uncharacterized protein n=1 Tax=Flagellimonas nanhaiensis TaxID=2292706 RepID=A0A371JQV1_9FLAO|nr:hypothetical protein [Allomuricauda nanhaiensis]RDY59813.1 hypothetical protein DX873_10685 [Allomuricauda nanhaiensis]
MKKALLLIGMLAAFHSCIPIRIAPKIQDYKVVKGKRFRRSLPKKTVFVFEDPKDANEFYNYVNTKFGLQDYYVDVEVPFIIDQKEYFFSFYEVEIPNKALNLFPFIFDAAFSAAVGNDGVEPILSDDAESVIRVGSWYIAIEVFSDSEKDCLHEDSISRDKVLTYLRELKNEYLSTQNYNEIVFKN